MKLLDYLLCFVVGMMIPGIITLAINALSSLIKRKELPAKDPEDHTLTKSSTPWQVDSYSCTNAGCRTSCEQSEFLSGICNTCGEHGVRLNYRSYRKIINEEGNWFYQYKYSTYSIIVNEKL